MSAAVDLIVHMRSTIMAAAASDCDVVVIGAGIAGCALAWVLAQDGRTVHVVERDMQVPDTFRGELLQPGGLRKLQELGLGRTCMRYPPGNGPVVNARHSVFTRADCVEGIDAQDCRGYVVFKQSSDVADGGAVKHDHVVIPYPSEASSEARSADLRDVVACGRSFHHGRFVERLRNQIATHPRYRRTQQSRPGQSRSED